MYSFNEDKYIHLRDNLANIKGKCLLSYAEVPMIRKFYKDFKIENTKEVRYTLSQNDHYTHELLIRNY